MKIAIIGTGVAGLTAAHLLHQEHEITVYEADDRVGGHVHTVDATQDGVHHAVDTGFIVFNDWTYPNFIRLLDRINVASQPSEMSFSVRNEQSGLEYSGSGLRGLFAQPQNLLRPAFHGMMRDILRFNRDAKAYIGNGADDKTVGGFVSDRGYSSMMRENYLVPMMAAIWSSDPARVAEFPARHYLEFFNNHGLLNISNRPQWRVIKGGSREYVRKLIAPFEDRIRLNSPVERICRSQNFVELYARKAKPERFDHVVVAVHSDQALRMLGDPSENERDILGAIGFQENDVTLHDDASLMPRARRAWASWNYHIPKGGSDRATLTYDMNRLQSLVSSKPLLVTLNRGDAIQGKSLRKSFVYHHPVFSAAAVDAQNRHAEISGVGRTHYCGAYWGWGFHEDGVNSSLKALKSFGVKL